MITIGLKLYQIFCKEVHLIYSKNIFAIGIDLKLL